MSALLTPQTAPRTTRDRTYWLAWIFLFPAVLGIIILRAPSMVFVPSLPFDEGAKVFAYFYQHRDAREILRFKSGYLPLIGNLIGYLAVRVPTRAIPYALAGSAVLISSVTYSFFFGRYFRRWIPSDLNRALICLILALAPIADCLLVTISDYSLWNLLIILIVLTVWRPSDRPLFRLLHGLTLNVLIWAHPLTIIIAPLVLWRAFAERASPTFYRVIFFNLIVHQVFGVAGILTTRGLWDHETGVPIDVSVISKLADATGWTIQIITATAFRTAFGSLTFQSTYRAGSTLPIIWISFCIAASGWVAYRNPQIRSLLLGLVYLIVALTFLSCFLRYEDVHGDPIGFIRYSPRYIYIQSLCFLLLFATLLSSGWGIIWAQSSNGERAARYAGWSAAPLAVLVCYYAILNTQFGYFVPNAKRTGPYYDTSPENGLIVQKFFNQLADRERINGSHRQIQLVAEKLNDWPIAIDTTISQPQLSLRMTHGARVLAVVLTLIVFSFLVGSWRKQWLVLRTG